jgi:hypothetical protein
MKNYLVCNDEPWSQDVCDFINNKGLLVMYKESLDDPDSDPITVITAKRGGIYVESTTPLDQDYLHGIITWFESDVFDMVYQNGFDIAPLYWDCVFQYEFCLHDWDEGYHNVSRCKKCGKYSV